MRLAFAPAVLVALLLAFAPGTSARPAPPAVPGWIVPGQVVVGLRDRASAPALGQRLAAAYGSAWSAVPGTHAVVLYVPEGQEEATARRLRHEAGVDFAEPTYILRLLREPNDTYYRGRQWNLQRIGMPQAWDMAIGAGAPAVAVIDSGVDASHPDLAGKLLPGWNAIANTIDVYDAEGHGTHVAGLLAAQTDNAQGIAGVTWSGKVVPVKVS
ncbi:MAG: S8 family serine peptidase, partial [Chloroflexi bacterium]|nr:S8 family serine peptidase [Chloroflexota bacterium]